MTERTFVGFGFGAIQAGLFLYEAYRSGNFDHLIVAEVMPDIVDAVRAGGGSYRVNVATNSGVERHKISGVEILNPRAPKDREALIGAIAAASEMATALPSVKFYGRGEDGDVVDILSAGIRLKMSRGGPRAVIYTAENDNRAAEILNEGLCRSLGLKGEPEHFQCLNTVIGKMSGVVADEKQIAEQGLDSVAPGIGRAFLVEEFNRILITRIAWRDFERGITVFEEKDDLLPFEEAKLFGHNATHALLGYLLRLKGRHFMAEARQDESLMRLAREAFLLESGKALCKKYTGTDFLFTEEGYTQYVDDLMERMLNSYLRDTVERITRDPRRKLGWDDRLVGTMRLALSQGITPDRYARGAAAALRALREEQGASEGDVLEDIWRTSDAAEAERRHVKELILKARS